MQRLLVRDRSDPGYGTEQGAEIIARAHAFVDYVEDKIRDCHAEDYAKLYAELRKRGAGREPRGGKTVASLTVLGVHGIDTALHCRAVCTEWRQWRRRPQ